MGHGCPSRQPRRRPHFSRQVVSSERLPDAYLNTAGRPYPAAGRHPAMDRRLPPHMRRDPRSWRPDMGPRPPHPSESASADGPALSVSGAAGPSGEPNAADAAAAAAGPASAGPASAATGARPGPDGRSEDAGFPFDSRRPPADPRKYGEWMMWRSSGMPRPDSDGGWPAGEARQRRAPWESRPNPSGPQPGPAADSDGNPDGGEEEGESEPGGRPPRGRAGNHRQWRAKHHGPNGRAGAAGGKGDPRQQWLEQWAGKEGFSGPEGNGWMGGRGQWGPGPGTSDGAAGEESLAAGGVDSWGSGGVAAGGGGLIGPRSQGLCGPARGLQGCAGQSGVALS